MRVLFVFPDLAADVTHYTGVLSPAVALLGGMLKNAGHEVALYHMLHEPTEEEFRARIRAKPCDLVAFSINSHYARRLRSWSTWAHEESGAPVAVGGVHPTLAPAQVSSNPHVHFTCVGEGEEALLELCDRLEAGKDTSDLRNFWVRTGTGIRSNEPRPLIAKLDDIPLPDYGIFDFDSLYNVRRGMFPFLMSRGCTFRCSYCSVPAMKELSGEGPRFWRFLSPEHAVEQLRTLLDRYLPDAKEVHFLDAILFAGKPWLRRFAPLYKERIGLPFSCNLRADFVTPDTAAILADMGCSIVRFGVESGDDDMNERVLLRRLDVQKIRMAFDTLRGAGIRRLSYNLVGLPEETLELALKTVSLNADLQPDVAVPFIFYPYPGTLLYEQCKDNGYLTELEYDNYFQGVTTNLPTFAPKDILFVHHFFHGLMRVYGVGRSLPAPLRGIWRRGVDAFFASPLLPRGTIVSMWKGYKRLRHGVGEHLVRRSPAAYRLLGGRDPV